MPFPTFVPAGAVALTPGLFHFCATSKTPTCPTRSVVARFTMSTARKFLVGGNWKCNLTQSTINELVAAFNAGPALDQSNVEVVVAPPSLYISRVRDSLRSDWAVSAQNCWLSKGGAFTGELDAVQIKDVGAEWVILGHSERRHIPTIRESDETVSAKTVYALGTGLKVIYCIGELLEEREAGQTLAVCERQLAALATAIADWSQVVIAYEPVWAIGTGKVATPEQAEEVHSAVRKWLEANVSRDVADSTRILYGGSVSPKNCDMLAKQPNIDGFLVGGASMQSSFLDIVESYKAALAGAV